MPLLCWDVVAQGINKRIEFASDINYLNNLLRGKKYHSAFPRAIDNRIVWENNTVIVTDPAQIIGFATKNIFEMTGYKPEEVIGGNPGIFQGKETCEKQKQIVRKAIAMLRPFDATILNYRKDGSIYKCHIEGYPLFDKNNRLINFIAFENAVHD